MDGTQFKPSGNAWCHWLYLFAAIGTASSAGLPDAVRLEIAELRQACETQGEALVPQPGFIRRFDINRDGQMDFILDASRLVCGQSASLFCGSAGCQVNVFVSGAQGYAEHLGHTVHSVRLLPGRRGAEMQVEFHGDVCGRAGVRRCTQRLSWRGEDFCRLPHRSTPHRAGRAPLFPPCG